MTWAPLKVTVLPPRSSPKFFPLILTAVSTGPLSGVNDFRVGPALGATLDARTAGAGDIVFPPATAKGIPLLDCPTELTTIRPLETPSGAATWISLSLQ